MSLPVVGVGVGVGIGAVVTGAVVNAAVFICSPAANAALLLAAGAAATAALLLNLGDAPGPLTAIDWPVSAFKQPPELHTSTLPWLVVIKN